MGLLSRFVRLNLATSTMMPIKWKIWLLNRCNNIRIDKDVILRENIIFAKRGITIKKGSLVNRGVLFLSTFPNSSILMRA